MTLEDIAEANRIKARIEAATDIDEMQAVVDQEREAVRKLDECDSTRVLAIQIKHLKEYVMRVVWPVGN